MNRSGCSQTRTAQNPKGATTTQFSVASAYFSLTTLPSFLPSLRFTFVIALNVNLPSRDRSQISLSLEALTRRRRLLPVSSSLHSPTPNTYLVIFFLNLERRRRPGAGEQPGLIRAVGRDNPERRLLRVRTSWRRTARTPTEAVRRPGLLGPFPLPLAMRPQARPVGRADRVAFSSYRKRPRPEDRGRGRARTSPEARPPRGERGARPPKNNWQRQWGRKESGESCVSSREALYSVL